MIYKIERIGRFTSSNIWKLTTSDKSGEKLGAPALTYIGEKKAERSLGRSVDLGATSNPLVWGKIMEYYCNKFELGLEYSLVSQETVVHPKYKFWSGSPDAEKTSTACEIKCYEPKKYYEYSMALMKLKEGLITISDFKEEFKQEYWQVVSNSILLKKPKSELIVFTPTEKQLIQIRKEIEETNILELLGIEIWQARFIVEKDIVHLPYIPEGIEYPNFVSYEFETPIEDVVFLTKRVLMAEKQLTA